MNLIRYYEIQKVIDSLRYSKKRMPDILQDLMITPDALCFKVYVKLSPFELVEFHNLCRLKINKKLMIKFLDGLKYSDKFSSKLPIKYLQDIANFIDDKSDRMTDGDYKHDIEYLMEFY